MTRSVARVVERVVRAVRPDAEQLHRSLERALPLLAQDLVAEDPLQVIAREVLRLKAVHDEVIEQDGDVVRPPRAQAALLPAPVAERPVRRREVRRALQLLRPDFRQAHDVAVHHGVKDGSDERLELVHDLELRV